MRKYLYRILAAVCLCMWKAEKTAANNGYLKFFKPFLLYNDADWLYNGLNSLTTESFLKNAEEYADNFSHHLIPRDHIIKQHIFMSILRDSGPKNDLEVTRSFIMLNANLTFEAYETAVIFRVCAFFYSKVKFDSVIQTACWNLSVYMEWYFSFMLKEKAEDLCKIKMLFPEERSTFSGPLKAENMCEILKKLNLNFLRFPGDKRIILPLPYDDNNVFNPNTLSRVDSNGLRSFKSIFDNYKYPRKFENQTLDEYYEMIYFDLWNCVMDAYTENFHKLFHYLSEVTIGSPKRERDIRMIVPFKIHKVLWDNASHFDEIRTLPTETRRGVVWYMYGGNIKSNSGSVMYRSNAIEILRQISYFYAFPKLTKTGLKVNEVMETVNSGDLKCRLESAKKQQNLSVDYVFHIYTEDIMPSKNK